MSDLYSTFQGLQPTATELLNAELLCQQILAAQYPDLDLRIGTALRDLVIRPSALLFALCKKGTDIYFAQNTLGSADDITPTDVVDSLLSNWFLDRKVGTQASISARLYFARAKNTSISNSVYFSTDGILKFFPADSFSYSSANMTFDSYSNEYYLDITLLAEAEGAQYNIGAG